jgi:hypothetical protein
MAKATFSNKIGYGPTVKSHVPNKSPCTLDELFELVQRGQGPPYQLKGMPKPAETNAEWLHRPIDHTNTTFIALGRVLALLQGLGGYTRGCANAPSRRKFHIFEELNPKG